MHQCSEVLSRLAALRRARRPTNNSAHGFTLIELLVVIAIIAVLAAILLPTLAKAKESGRAVFCRNNTRQLTVAWINYAQDSEDRLATNSIEPNTNGWTAGDLHWDRTTDTDNTNHLKLMSPVGLIWPYTRSLGVYKCPSDRATAQVNGRYYPLVRSYSINCRLNGPDWPFSPTHDWLNPAKLAQVTRPTPANAFAFIDERCDTIDDGCFGVDTVDTGASALLCNIPANYHSGASEISFVDGHTESRKWVDKRTDPPYKANVYTGYIHVPNDPDIAWLQLRCSAHR